MKQTLGNRVVTHLGSLYRDRENGLLLGVCAGLAHAYRVNALGVRVIAVLLLVWLPVPTAVAYLALGLTLRDAPLRYSGSEQERCFWRAARSDPGVDG